MATWDNFQCVCFVDKIQRIYCGTISLTWVDFIPAWRSYYVNYKVWDGIINPSTNFNAATTEVQEWVSTFTSHFTRHVITYPCLDWNSRNRRLSVTADLGPDRDELNIEDEIKCPTFCSRYININFIEKKFWLRFEYQLNWFLKVCLK